MTLTDAENAAELSRVHERYARAAEIRGGDLLGLNRLTEAAVAGDRAKAHRAVSVHYAAVGRLLRGIERGEPRVTDAVVASVHDLSAVVVEREGDR